MSNIPRETQDLIMKQVKKTLGKSISGVKIELLGGVAEILRDGLNGEQHAYITHATVQVSIIAERGIPLYTYEPLVVEVGTDVIVTGLDVPIHFGMQERD